MFKLCLLVVATLALGLQAVRGQLEGGINAAPNALPYHVFLRKAEDFVCSGALISRIHVLTTAYCILQLHNGINDDVLTLANAIVGTNNAHDGSGQRIPIVDMEFDDQCYSMTALQLRWNIGLLMLEYEVNPLNVEILFLPNTRQIPIGLDAVVSGRPLNHSPESVLQELPVHIRDRPICQHVTNEFTVGESYLCTHISPNYAHCGIYTGDPLVKDSVIIGVATGVCSNYTTNGTLCIFINVIKFAKWLKKYIDPYNPFPSRKQLKHGKIIPLGQ